MERTWPSEPLSVGTPWWSDALFIKEIKRKAFHLLSLLYAAVYAFLGRQETCILLGGLLAVIAAIEISRLKSSRMNAWLEGYFGGIQRPEEKRRLSGIFWTLAGSWLTFLLIPDRNLVFCVMGYLAFGDLAAALVGLRFGRHRFSGKSVEGCLAFFCVAMAVGLAFLPLPFAVAGALFAAAVECLPLPWNDNFWVPLLSGLLLTLIV
jgi:glycerol-3-phosphate acyltransferase PlsY